MSLLLIVLLPLLGSLVPLMGSNERRNTCAIMTAVAPAIALAAGAGDCASVDRDCDAFGSAVVGAGGEVPGHKSDGPVS